MACWRLLAVSGALLGCAAFFLSSRYKLVLFKVAHAAEREPRDTQAFHPSETEKDDYSATRAGVQGAPVGKASIDAFLARAHVSAPVAQTTPTSTPTPPPTRTPTPTTTPTPASGPHSHETCPGLTRSTKCIDSSSHLLPEKKSSYKIPSDLAAMLAPENTVQVQQKLINSDICVIAMGDSTLEETVEDIGAMLGEVDGTRKSAEEIWKWIDTWMNATVSQSKPGAHFDAPLFRASYFPNHRKMSIVARGGRFVLYYRFIGHPEIDKNWMGLRSLLNEPLREEIVSGADKWCGNLRRVVWLQVGYHEKRQERKHFHKSGLPDVYRKVLPWVEQLAPERYWLMRQGEDLDQLNQWLRAELQNPSRNHKNWSIMDYKVPWACEKRNIEQVRAHTGSIERWWHSRKTLDKYPDYYLSMLRTMKIVQHMLC
ncbi:unnamed protein product [Symbiodinium natans]|uniref:Uncharacterized protein n=1 Tax=Symbiodinium natans TaxID=878477 RepID=A0A812ND73_9DINO|nr:unnamed protein product [Symbiodinium natans]